MKWYKRYDLEMLVIAVAFATALLEGAQVLGYEVIQ
jgi:hypothetical protein